MANTARERKEETYNTENITLKDVIKYINTEIIKDYTVNSRDYVCTTK